MLRMCAWCRNVQDPDGSWRPLHDYVQAVETVTHGMCPACLEKKLAEISEFGRPPAAAAK